MLQTPAEPMVPGDLNYPHISRSLLHGWVAILTLFNFGQKDDSSGHTTTTSIYFLSVHQITAQTIGQTEDTPFIAPMDNEQLYT